MRPWVKPLFIIAGIYEGLLGLVFLIAPLALFEWQGVEPPNHVGYVQFPALLLLLFAVMFFRIAQAPLKRRELILYGCGLKFAYCATVFWYAFSTGIPAMWMPWAWADLLFLVLFALSWKSLGDVIQGD